MGVYLFFTMENFKHWEAEHFITNPYFDRSTSFNEDQFIANFVSFTPLPTYPLPFLYWIVLKHIIDTISFHS